MVKPYINFPFDMPLVKLYVCVTCMSVQFWVSPLISVLNRSAVHKTNSLSVVVTTIKSEPNSITVCCWYKLMCFFVLGIVGALLGHKLCKLKFVWVIVPHCIHIV